MKLGLLQEVENRKISIHQNPIFPRTGSWRFISKLFSKVQLMSRYCINRQRNSKQLVSIGEMLQDFVHLCLILNITDFFVPQGILKNLFPSWFAIMRFEEVVGFTCGLMPDPSPLCHYTYHMFNKYNRDRVKACNITLCRKTEKELNAMGKTAKNTDFFKLLYSESRVPLPGSPLHNEYCNLFDHSKKQMSTIDIYIPSEHFEFRHLKRKVLCIKDNPRGTIAKPCSMMILNPDQDVADDLISVCCSISQHQSVSNLWLQDIRCKTKFSQNVIQLSGEPETFVMIDCLLPLNIVEDFLQQMARAKKLQLLEIRNVNIGDFGQLLLNAITSWKFNSQMWHLGVNNCNLLQDLWSELFKKLHLCEHLRQLSFNSSDMSDMNNALPEVIRKLYELECLSLRNCTIPESQCAQIIKALFQCKYITTLDLSGNKVGNSGRYLAEIIKQWGKDPPLQSHVS